MKKISSSPDRHTFQAENYVKRCEEKGEEPSEDYLNLYKSAKQQDTENMIDMVTKSLVLFGLENENGIIINFIY